MTVKPFSPAEARGHKISTIPPVVYESVNELLAMKFSSGGMVTIKQDELIDLILSKQSPMASDGSNICRAKLFGNHWLDFEDAYRNEGWHVEYDKPAYNESYGAFWTFKEKR